MAHECLTCGQACYCDGEDTVLDSKSHDCRTFACEYDTSELEDEMADIIDAVPELWPTAETSHSDQPGEKS